MYYGYSHYIDEKAEVHRGHKANKRHEGVKSRQSDSEVHRLNLHTRSSLLLNSANVGTNLTVCQKEIY